MNNYTEVTFHFHIPAAGEQLTSDTAADVLSAMLADIGYESFVPVSYTHLRAHET